jgi:hypothetical protein
MPDATSKNHLGWVPFASWHPLACHCQEHFHFYLVCATMGTVFGSRHFPCVTGVARPSLKKRLPGSELCSEE